MPDPDGSVAASSLVRATVAASRADFAAVVNKHAASKAPREVMLSLAGHFDAARHRSLRLLAVLSHARASAAPSGVDAARMRAAALAQLGAMEHTVEGATAQLAARAAEILGNRSLSAAVEDAARTVRGERGFRRVYTACSRFEMADSPYIHLVARRGEVFFALGREIRPLFSIPSTNSATACAKGRA